MLFAVSVSWSIVRHCPSPSSQGANTLRGDNLLALLCSLSAGPLVQERGDTSTWPRVTSKRLAPWQGAFPPLVDHPGRCHLDCQCATRVTTCLLTIQTHPSLSTWSWTSISVKGQVAWSFSFLCAWPHGRGDDESGVDGIIQVHSG